MNALLKESDIRPPETMGEQAGAFLRDIGWLLSRSAEFVPVDCPACTWDKSTLRYIKHSLRYVECSGCETVYMSPRPPEKLLSEFYQRSENYQHWAKVVFPASEEVRRQKIVAPRVDRILEIVKKYEVDPWKLAEVGAGFGTFCAELKSRDVFHSVLAIEPTPDLAAKCREKGIKTIESTVEKCDFGRPDVMVSFEVIEHLFDPRRFVEACFKGLRRGGILVLTCPNIKGFETAMLGTASSTIDAEHLNYFHPESLAMLLKSVGFEVLECQTPGQLDTDLVRQKLQSGEVQNGFWQDVLVKRWEEVGEDFQRFLSSHNLSSNMWIVGKKPN